MRREFNVVLFPVHVLHAQASSVNADSVQTDIPNYPTHQ